MIPLILSSLFPNILEMDTDSKHSAQETIQDVDFVQEDLQSKVSKPLVS